MDIQFFTIYDGPEGALVQVEYLNQYQVGGGVKGDIYDDWRHAVLPPGMGSIPGGDPVPGQLGQWTVDLNNGCVGMNLGLVRQQRRISAQLHGAENGDQQAAVYLNDMAKMYEQPAQT